MPRRILLLITDLEIGGTPTVVRELALRLREPGRVQIEVACLSKWGPVADQLSDAGVTVTALGASGPLDFRVFARLIRLIRSHAIDTVFSFLVHANTAAAVASLLCPNVRFIQSIQTTQPRPRWHWLVQRMVQRAADRIVVPSASAAGVARDWADVPASKLVVIPNAVDVPDAPTPRSWDESIIHIGFLGRLDPIKRVPDLVVALSQLDRRFVLEIYGEGSDRSRIQSEIAQRNLADRVTLHGATTSPQSAIASMHVLVLPSEAEGFGLVLIETMAAGVPVIGTDVAGIRDVVQDGLTGMLVPAGSPKHLASAIDRLSRDPLFRQKLVQSASTVAGEQFSWRPVAVSYRALLGI